MTIKSAFARAMRKTLNKGYKPLKGFTVVSFASVIRDEHSFVEFRVKKDGEDKELRADIALNDILFDTDWARLLWGEELGLVNLCGMVTCPTTPERLKYLGEHL